MDLRICIAIAVIASAALAHAQNVSGQDSSNWTYDSKTGQLNGAASGNQRQAAQQIVDLELAEYRAWNKHDLEGVLSVYWNSPNLVSIAGDEPEVHGFENLRSELLSAYADPSTMGRIDLDSLRVQVITDDWACCVASYVVHTAAHVYYCDDTATLKRLPEGWKIVFEHATIVTH